MLVYPPPFLGAQKSGKEANAMFFLTKKGKVQEFSSSAPPPPPVASFGGEGLPPFGFHSPPPGITLRFLVIFEQEMTIFSFYYYGQNYMF